VKIFISFDTDQNPFFDTFGIKVNYLQYLEVPYGYFGPVITLNIFKNNIFLINSIRAFEWCMNCHTSNKKKIRFLLVRVPFYGIQAQFFFKRGMTIHTPFESPD
jgi:hypothetical protein